VNRTIVKAAAFLVLIMGFIFIAATVSEAQVYQSPMTFGREEFAEHRPFRRARAGRGGAFIAIADDGTAASWNPAALIILERPEAA